MVYHLQNKKQYNFRSIEIDENNTEFCSVDGMVLTKDRSKLLYSFENMFKDGFKLPDEVEVIGKYAVSGNEDLKDLTIPEGITFIDEGAFSYCRNLKNISFPKSLRRIEGSAFAECDISNVKFNEGLEYIGAGAFSENKIDRVLLPKSIRSIGKAVFSETADIEIYDTIDPDAGEAESGIDMSNGRPNSSVGYACAQRDLIDRDGIPPEESDYSWTDYTITVKSAETDKVKYKVWMGAYSSNRDYHCLLASGWGKNATFAFNALDKYFPKIKGKKNKLKVAEYRLMYTYELSEADREMYINYVKKSVIRSAIKRGVN